LLCGLLLAVPALAGEDRQRAVDRIAKLGGKYQVTKDDPANSPASTSSSGSSPPAASPRSILSVQPGRPGSLRSWLRG
jgi:hypothetical protein